MPTKAILHRHRQASHLALVAETHRQEVAAELDRINAPLSRVSGVHLDFADVQRLQAFFVAFYFHRLWDADNAYQAKKTNAYPLRDRRDDLTKELYDKVVALRGVLERLYCRKTATSITGFEGKTPRDPHELALMSIFLLSRLRTLKLETFPAPTLSVIPLDLPKIADELEPLVLELNRVLRELQNWSQSEAALLKARNRAQADFDRMRTSVAVTLAGLYRAAGLAELIPQITNPHVSVEKELERKRKHPMPPPEVTEENWPPPELPPHPVQAQSSMDRCTEGGKTPQPDPQKPGFPPGATPPFDGSLQKRRRHYAAEDPWIGFAPGARAVFNGWLR